MPPGLELFQPGLPENAASSARRQFFAVAGNDHPAWPVAVNVNSMTALAPVFQFDPPGGDDQPFQLTMRHRLAKLSLPHSCGWRISVLVPPAN